LRWQSEQLGQPRAAEVGTRMLEGSLLAFVVFAVFFEFFLDLSHVANGMLRSTVAPALLILAGLYLLMRRRPRLSEADHR